MIENMKKVETTDTTFTESKNSMKAVAGKLPSLFESQKTDLNLMKID